MSRSVPKLSKTGQGVCGNPSCVEPKAPDSLMCPPHRDNMARIRQEMLDDPTLLYNQRSDNPARKYREGFSPKKGSGKRHPTCKKAGCFEIRVPPSTHCWEHEGESNESE